jgi:predicted choloylglycine hydrolase
MKGAEMKIRLSRLTRREMMKQAAIIMGVASSPLSGLSGKKNKSMKGDAITAPSDDRSFPYLEFTAPTYFDLGETIGKTFARQIQLGLTRRESWIKKLKEFAEGDMEGRYNGFIRELEEHFPQYLEELKGQAQGAEVPFMDLMVLNLNPEFSALMRNPERILNCSTVMARGADRVMLAHNEDGADAYRDICYILKIKAPSNVTFLCMSYPGIIQGMAPGFNDQGIAHTCNFIGAKEVRIGVPRYFIDRAMLEARSLDEAIKTASHKRRSYSQNHNLVSYKDKRALMIETAPSKYQVKDISGIAVHANHFVMDEMKEVPEFMLNVAASTPRYNILKQEAEKIPDQDMPAADQLVSILATHRGKPFCPCRHPSQTGPGCTLGTALFDTSNNYMKLYKNNPCENKYKKYA